MSKAVKHIIRLNNELVPFEYIEWHALEKKVSLHSVTGWSDPYVNKAINHEVILLLPAQWVYLTQSQIPSKNVEIIRQSVAYAIEEELTNDVEENVYAFNSISEKEQIVCVINKRQYQLLLKTIKHNKLNVKEVFSELILCPWQDEKPFVFVGKEHQSAAKDSVLIRTGLTEGLSCDLQQMNALLEAFIDTSDAANYYAEKPNEVLQSKGFAHVGLYDAVSHVATSQLPNILLEGLTEEKTQAMVKSGQRKIVMMAAAVIASWIFIHAYEYVRLSGTIDEAQQQQLQLLKSTFPSVSDNELNNPYAAWQSRLRSGNAESGASQELLSGLKDVGEAMLDTTGIQIDALRMVDNSIELSLIANSSNEINQFQDKLTQESLRFAVNVGTKEATSDGLKAIITMRLL